MTLIGNLSKFLNIFSPISSKELVIQSSEGETVLGIKRFNPILYRWYKNDKRKSLSFASKLKDIITNGGLIAVYEGEIDQEVVKRIFHSIEKKLDQDKENIKIKKRLMHIIIGLLQNISKYSTGIEKGKGGILVGKNSETYYVLTRNEIDRNQMMHLTYIIDTTNQEMMTNGLSELFQNKIINSQFTEGGGAGLGLVDIARKSKQMIEYFVEPLSNGNSAFYIKVIISKENNASQVVIS